MTKTQLKLRNTFATSCFIIFFLAFFTILAHVSKVEAGEFFPIEGKTELFLGGWSTHLVTEGKLNENHKGVGINYHGTMAVFFQNSYDEDSIMLGQTVYKHTGKYADFEMLIGAVHGYDHCFGEYDKGVTKKKVIACPIAIPSITIHTGYAIEPQFLMFGDAATVALKYTFD